MRLISSVRVWVARDDAEDDEFEMNFVKSLSSCFEKMIEVVTEQKPRVADRLRKASRRSRSAAVPTMKVTHTTTSRRRWHGRQRHFRSGNCRLILVAVVDHGVSLLSKRFHHHALMQFDPVFDFLFNGVTSNFGCQTVHATRNCTSNII